MVPEGEEAVELVTGDDGDDRVPLRPPRLIDVARAQPRPGRTVPGVAPTSTIHQREQTQLIRSSLGRIAVMAREADPVVGTAGALTFIAPQPVTPAGVFPLGCRTRRLDESLRVKLQLGDRGLSELLGWADGALDVVIAQGWALVTQRPEQRGAKRGRNSAYAGFTVSSGGIERLGLRKNHVALLGVAAGDELLVAALPDYGALAMCNPDLIAALAPSHIARLLSPVHDTTTPTETPPAHDPSTATSTKGTR